MSSIAYDVFTKRAVVLGPENPLDMVNLFHQTMREHQWITNIANIFTGIFSLSMAIFLASVFIWRRSLVNRVSLRLIFAISICDCIQLLVQIINYWEYSLTSCLAERFFMNTFLRASMYLSSAIAFNLQMVFLRKSRSPLPRYVEYLYYIIPFTIAIIHSMVHIIISATEGVCDMFNLVPNASKSYVIYVIFQCLLLPSIFIFYNVIATVTIIVTLYLRQRRVGRALELVSRRTRELFVTGKDDKDAGLRTISAKEAEHLKTAQKVYSACIRIALYPLAPVIWWIFLTIYYTLQYPITLTYKSDVPKLLKIDILTWFAYTGISFINFVVFVTDPALKKVISEVRSAIRMKLAERRMRASSSQDTLASSDDSITKLPDMVLSESYESDATHDNNVTSVGLRNDMHYTNSFYSADRFGTLEGSQSTSTMVLNSDSVVRRIRSDGDADSFMDKL